MAHHAPVLEIDARARGPLDELLKVGAPLLGGGAKAVARMHATGAADYALRIDLPLEAMDQARVRAGVVLGGNDLRLLPQAPVLSQARGTLDFAETGFTLAGVQARLAGGEARIEGHGRYTGPAGTDLAFTAQGQATAEGLRTLREVPPLAAMARRASGAMRYDATLALRGGVARLAELAPDTLFVPLALDYAFWEERGAEACAAFGAPIRGADLLALPRPERLARMEAALTGTLDRLAADVIARDPARFTALVSGAKGVGGVYDLGRRLRAALTGRRFEPAHRVEEDRMAEEDRLP